MVLRTLNLVLTLAIIGIVIFVGYQAFQLFQDAGGIGNYFEDLGADTAAAGTGFVAGAVGGLFNFGKDLGNRFNPFD